MGEFRWRLNLLIMVAIPIAAALGNSVASSDVCKDYGNDICLCHRNPECVSLQWGDCVNVKEVCEDFQFSPKDCRRNGDNYANNGVICKFHGKNGGNCAARKIPFSLKNPSYSKDSPASEEFGLFVNGRSDLLSNNGIVCPVYQIPVKSTGHYQMILRKIRDVPEMTFDIWVNGVVLFRETIGGHVAIGERIRINYAVETNNLGQVFFTTNENRMLELDGEFMELRLCYGVCTTANPAYPEFYLELMDVLKFKRHHHHGNPILIRSKRDAADHIILNVGLDAVTKPNATTTVGTKKPKSKSSEENSEKKKTTTAPSHTTTATP